MANALFDWNEGIFDESLEEVVLERRTRIQPKSAEEIARFCIDEKLSPTQRTLHLLRGVEVQRLRALADLPQFVARHPKEAKSDVLPVVRGLVPSMGIQDVTVTAKSFAEIAGQKNLDDDTFEAVCLRCILQGCKAGEEPVITEWISCLLECITFLPENTLKKQILELLLRNGQQVQPAERRIESCRLIAAVSKRLPSPWLKKEVLPLARLLSQDLNREVRKAMAKEMHLLCKGLGKDVAQADVLSDVVELLQDDQPDVRLAAMESLVPLLALFSEDTAQKLLVPAMQVFLECKENSQMSAILPLSNLLARFLYNTREYLPDDQLEELVEMFCWFASQESDVMLSPEPGNRTQGMTSEWNECSLDDMTQCRHNCAYNLPAVASVCGPITFANACLPTLRILQLDDCPTVRRTLACGLHEIVRIMSPNSQPLLQVVLGLLKDDNVWVVLALLKNLPTMLEVILGDYPEDRAIVNDLSAAMLLSNTMAAANRQWRLHEEMLVSWACLPRLFPEDVVYGKFAPVVVGQLENHVLPVKMAAAETLTSFIIYARRASQRAELCEKMIQSCAQDKSSRLRSLFLDICLTYMRLFSRSLFKEHFFSAIIALGEDPAGGVRQKVCKFLPELKTMLTLPADRAYWQSIERLVEDLLVNEYDDCVGAVVRHTRAELDRRQIRVQSGAAGAPLDLELEEEDQRKEAEELSMMVCAEDEVDGCKRPPLPPSQQSDGKRSAKTGRRLSGAKAAVAGGPPSPGILNRRTSAPQVASPASARRAGGARSTSTGSLSKAGAAGATSAASASSNGTSSKTPTSPKLSGPTMNRQLSSGGGASSLASSATSVRAPSSPAARIKKEATSRRVNSLSSLDSCGRDGGAKAVDSPGTARPSGAVKLPSINAHSRGPQPRSKFGKASPSGASGGSRKPPTLVLPPSFKPSRLSPSPS